MSTTLITRPPGDDIAPVVPRRERPGRVRAAWDKYWYAWAMVAPVVVVLGILVLYPLLRGIWLSLTNINEANQSLQICRPSLAGGKVCKANPDAWRFTWFRNYVDVLTGHTGSFWQWFRVTVVWTLACVGPTFGIGLGLAVLLNREMRGRTLYRVLLIVPWAVPAFISAFAWRFLYDENFGLFNAVLRGLGLEPVHWYAHQSTALFAAVTVNVWIGIPFMMVALLGGLQAIPADLYEAAAMDGASPWKRFVHVTLPGLQPVSLTVLLLGIVWTFNMFPIIYLVTGGAPAGKTEILVTGAYRAAFSGVRNYSLAATYGVLILSMLILFAASYRRALSKHGEVL